ncbi:hypothetical protein [Microtetraspora fusca]|uniref:hypothetical protein n=1 Tax=Microtetraspora fusca TaxID=1997 RepID=UPI000836B396|nr:hypothetical protein [Microtetraspora fusca]
MTTRSSDHALAWLGHPVTVLALAVLLLNDHVLKGLWPGPVTGKLSDVAGLVVAPPLAALLLRCPAPAAIALTGTLFTLVKATAAGAEAASWLWSLLIPSRVVADPTDLIALPALGLAWLAWRRAARRPPVRLPRAVLVVPVAVFAVTATSAAPPAPSAVSVAVSGTAVVVDVTEVQARASTDGGATWHPWTENQTYAPQSSACVPGEQAHCYRIRPGLLGVEETADGGSTWSTSWAVSSGRRHWLDRTYRNSDPQRLPTDLAASRALAVQAVPGGAGAHIVVVANGPDGVAVRDASGLWRRLGFAADGGFSARDAAPLIDPGEQIYDELWIAALIAVTVLLVGLAGDGFLERARAAFGIAGLLLWIGLLLFVGAPVLEWPFGLVAWLAGYLLVLAGGVGVLVVWAVHQKHTERAGGRSALVALVTFAGVYLPFLGWSAGLPDTYGTAVLLAVILGAAAPGWLIARRILQKGEGPAGRISTTATPE